MEREASICTSARKITIYEKAAQKIGLEVEIQEAGSTTDLKDRIIFVKIPDGTRLNELLNAVYELAGGKDEFYGKDKTEEKRETQKMGSPTHFARIKRLLHQKFGSSSTDSL